MAREIYDFEQDSFKVEPSDVSIIQELQNFVINNTPLESCLPDIELISKGYYRRNIGNSVWYLHPELLKIMSPYDLSRYAMLLNMRNYRDGITNLSISAFIFTQDKKQLRDARGLDDADFDRFDTFRCTPDGYGNYRKNGSMNGPKAMSQKRRNNNKMFLQTLMYGKFDEEDNIRCAFTGENVENLKTPDDSTNTVKFIDIFHLHHVYFSGGTSIDKSEGPAHYLNKQNFETFTHNTVLEFLGCIILSDSSHSRLHKAQREDDITGWFKKKSRGDISYLPSHWVNEENYTKTITRLGDMCPYFNIKIAPSYMEFLVRNTHPKNLQCLLPGYIVPIPVSPVVNNFSQIFDSLRSTKTDPIPQTPIPCSLEIDPQQSLDFEDTQPTSLCEIS